MKHPLFIISVFLMFYSSFAFAAPPAPIPQTGQTTCYNESGTAITCVGTGQDGELQTGVALPNPRFTDNGDQTITDSLTRLIWTKDANVMKTRNPIFDAAGLPMDVGVTWQQALDYVTQLNSENYLGYNDWRLPNINELESIGNSGKANTAAWLNGQGFLNTHENYYWSSSTFSLYTNFARIVDLKYNIPSWGAKNANFYVWPVRGGLSGFMGTLRLSKTGQTICFDTSGVAIACSGTGQDGDLLNGIAWPATRFIDNELTNSPDKTVTDNLTGLIWSKDANIASVSKTWQQALDYIANINSISYLGHNDWRLPNRNELESLVNQGQINTATWLNNQGFANVMNNYWTSSSSIGSANNAWYVNMNDGYASYVTKKDYFFYVWPVRAGYSEKILSVSKSGTGSGTLTSSVGGINCGSICSVAIASGEIVDLFVAADSGSVFSGWSGVCSGAAICEVTMDTAKSVTANFALAPINGTCGSSNGISEAIAPTSNFCTTGTATPVTGTGPWSWACNGSNGGTTATCNASIQTYTINTTVTDGIGTVSCTSPVNSSAASACTITSATGYQVATFTDNGVDKAGAIVSNSYSIPGVTADHSIAVTFSQIPPVQFTVTPTTSTGYSITPATAQNINQNATTSFSVISASGYGIAAISGCGGSLSGTTYTTGTITADCTVSVTAVARNAGSGGAAQPPTITDALKVLLAVVGTAPLTASDQIRYDVAPLSASGTPVGNGAIDAADVILILRRSIGIGSW